MNQEQFEIVKEYIGLTPDLGSTRPGPIHGSKDGPDGSKDGADQSNTGLRADNPYNRILWIDPN